MSTDFTNPLSFSNFKASDWQSSYPPNTGMLDAPAPVPIDPGNQAALAGSVSEEAPSVAAKVSNSNVLYVLGCAGACLWSFVNACLCWSLIARIYSYYKHKSLNDGIEKAQIAKLAEGLDVIVGGNRLGEIAEFNRPDPTIGHFSQEALTENILRQGIEGIDPASASEMAKKVIQIKMMIHSLRKEGSSFWLDVATVRNRIADVMNMPIYRQLARNRDCAAVNFLQILAVKLISADGQETLREYGKECLGKEQFDEQPGRTFRPEELADQLSGYLNGVSFNVNTFCHIPVGRILWSAAHPKLAMHSLHAGTHPLNYNASSMNPHFAGHSFKKEDKEFGFYYGPGPTGDPLFEFGILPAYEKFGSFELRFNHQNTNSSQDHFRIADALSMANKQHLHAVVSFDKTWVDPLCKKFESPEDFFTKLRVHVQGDLRELANPKEDNGFFIPEDLLDDSQVDLALSKSEEFCEKLSAGNSHWEAQMQNETGKRRMGKMMVLIADTFLTLGMLYKSFDRITPEMVENCLNEKLDKDLFSIRTSGACKQNVDRAVVENISLRLFFRWASDPSPLTADEVCEIAGAVFGRARIVDDRNIQMKRYQILDDLLRFIGGSPNGGGLLMAHGALSEYQEALCSSNSEKTAGTSRWIPGFSLLTLPISWFSALSRKIFW